MFSLKTHHLSFAVHGQTPPLSLLFCHLIRTIFKLKRFIFNILIFLGYSCRSCQFRSQQLALGYQLGFLSLREGERREGGREKWRRGEEWEREGGRGKSRKKERRKWENKHRVPVKSGYNTRRTIIFSTRRQNLIIILLSVYYLTYDLSTRDKRPIWLECENEVFVVFPKNLIFTFQSYRSLFPCPLISKSR